MRVSPEIRGRKVGLPEGVHGVVLREQPCPDGVREDNEDVTSYWAAETSFQDVMVSEKTRARARALDRTFFQTGCMANGTKSNASKKERGYPPSPA